MVVAFYAKNKSNAVISNICKPAVERWQKRYKLAREQAKLLLERSKATGGSVLVANAETDYNGYKTEQDALEIFKKDLEKLSLYARHLQPMLRERLDDDDDDEEVNLSNIVMSHYRLSKLRQTPILIVSPKKNKFHTSALYTI